MCVTDHSSLARHASLPAAFVRCLFTLALATVNAVPASSDVRFERLTVEQGLLGTYVIDLAQDVNGFLWIADLNQGLIRYDGYDFRAYRHNPGDPGSISSNEVTVLYVDRAGTFWVGTNAGLNRYDARSDQFTRIATNSTAPAGLSSDNISSVLVDSAGRLWVSTGKGLNRLDPGAKRFQQYHVERGYIGGSMEPDSFWTAFEDSAKRLWFGTLGGGLLRYNPTSDSLEQYLYERTPESPPVINLNSIAEDRFGQLWLASENGLSTLDPITMTFHRIHWKNSVENINELGLPDMQLQFWSVLEDAAGNIWLTTVGAGVFRIAPDRRSWTQFQHEPNNLYSLSGNNVWKVFTDHSGQLWFASAEDGLNRYNPLTDAIDFVTPPNPGDISSLSKLAALPDGRLLVGTANQGIWVLNPGNQSWTPLPWPARPESQIARDSNLTEHRTVQGLWVTPDSTVWVSGSPFPKLFRVDATLTSTKTFQQRNRPSFVYLDRQGLLWVGAPYKGLDRFNLTTGEKTEWQSDPKNEESLGHSAIWTMFEDKRGRFWIGTYRGLELMDRATGHFKHYDPDPGRPGSLPAGDVSQIAEDERGDLWINSDAGVSRYIPESDGFENFPLHESPIDASVQGGHAGIVHDRLLWGSATGLTSFDLRERRYRRYGPGQGITNPPMDVAALPDGRIALAYPGRIGLFSPDRLIPDPTRPQVSLTGVMLGNRRLDSLDDAGNAELNSSAWTATQITLPHDHAPLTFEFAAMHFAAPSRNRYAYRLEGLDDDWIETDARNRRATYTTLPPGSYVFRVKAANPDGLWNEDGLAFELTVLPPWWMTWWAYTLYAVAASLLLALTVWYRTRTLRTRATVLEKQVAERTQELIEQKEIVERQAHHLEELADIKDRLMTRISHEFRTPLTVILGPIERLQAVIDNDFLRTYLATAKRNASRLLRLVDQLLGLARLRSGHAEPTCPVSAAPIIRQVTASFESLAADRELDLALDVIDDLTLQTTVDALEKITVNLVSNAIKYSSPGGRIRISLAGGASDAGTLIVSDTGRGISPVRLPHIFEPFERGHDEAERIPGSGLGLALVHELATAHGGQVQVESTPQVGSTFRVLLPLATTQALRFESDVAVSEEALLAVATLSSENDAMPISSPAPAVGASILVIEDNADMRDYLGQVLGDAYQLAFAGDGNSGLEMAVAEIPDLVVCDIMLPGRDGYEVCHALKTDDRTSHIPVILLTALEGREDRLKGLAEKADDYLTKPFDEAELKQRITNLLDLRTLLQRRFARDLRFDESPPAELSKRDQSFLQKLARVTGEHYADSSLDLARLASAMAVGERNLQRKLKALVGMTPGEYLREYRLQQAMERLRAGERPGDVAFAIGFTSQAYFSTCFRAQFGYPPSEVREKIRQH